MDSTVIEVEFQELCRICANPKAQDDQSRMISIFEKDGIGIELLDKIKRYLPIDVSICTYYAYCIGDIYVYHV
jgi:hypothetical protein